MFNHHLFYWIAMHTSFFCTFVEFYEQNIFFLCAAVARNGAALLAGAELPLSSPTSSAETSPPPTRLETARLKALVSAVDLVL